MDDPRQTIASLLETAESMVWHLEASSIKPDYSEDTFRSIVKLFASAIMDRLFESITADNLSQREANELSLAAGELIKQLVADTTGINTHELYLKEEE